jgi:hypothetical protein
VCDLRWIGGRRAYTSDTDGDWLPFSTAAASGRGVGHRPLGWGPVYGTGQLGGGSGARRQAVLTGDQQPAVQGQVPAEAPILAVEGAAGRETTRWPPLGAAWPRYSACRPAGRVMPQMVSSPASMPRVPC